MINRISNSIRNIGLKFKNQKNNNSNGKLYSQNDQEMIDTFRAYIATETYRSCYYEHDGDFNKFIEKGDETIDRIIEKSPKYSEQRNRIQEILESQIREMFELIHSYGGENSYPPPLKNLPYYSMEEKLKRCLQIKQTNIQGKPIDHPRGFRLHVKKSDINHEEAGYGVHVEGECVPGTIVAIYPGDTYDGDNIPSNVVSDNDYMMSRYDGTVIDGRSWNRRADELILKEKFFNKLGTKSTGTDLLCYKNPFAIGNFINHPPIIKDNNGNDTDQTKEPNVIAYSFNFRSNFPNHLSFYIPNKTATEHSIFKDSSVLRRSLLLVAFKPIKNQEIFLNYRFNPDLPYPNWYKQPDLEEAKRRWGSRRSLSIHSILNRN
ncbi:hypothetical protein RB653_006457 [Dictyostelium firmibasis]|uniref:SET domain-containing protein n=1 Tax=Dictyostelium firmibasis TaxID=79012 RepID=A0AAN7Z596_9MYCE